MSLTSIAHQELVSLYLDLKPSEEVDLEVAAEAAIRWARALKAAAAAVNPKYNYRVQLVAAEPGSKRWLAKIERSSVNQFAKQVKAGWDEVPLILRAGIALAVVIPLTVKPTINYWLGNDGFSESEKAYLREIIGTSVSDPAVKNYKKQMYTELQRDRNITGVGGGIPDRENWRPRDLVPANQFAMGTGLFEIQEEPEQEKTTSQELDVILVAPNLDNPKSTWVFRQDGISGHIRAVMADAKFLTALEQSSVKEAFRTHIPMKIRLQIKQIKVNDEWKVKNRGRSVVEVISPETG
jgi:hypothetical protein